MIFPILNFGLDHFASRPFNCMLYKQGVTELEAFILMMKCTIGKRYSKLSRLLQEDHALSSTFYPLGNYLYIKHKNSSEVT